MATYIVLVKITPEGAKNLKEGPQRFAKYTEAIRAQGGKISAAYATLGRYDYVTIIDCPEDISKVFKSSAAVAMVGALTNVRPRPLCPYRTSSKQWQSFSSEYELINTSSSYRFLKDYWPVCDLVLHTVAMAIHTIDMQVGGTGFEYS